MRHCRNGCLAAAVALMTIGCSGSTSSRKASPPNIDGASASGPLTTSTVVPGEVNFADYEAGVLAFADCLTEAGYPLIDLERQADEPRLYSYLIPFPAMDSGDEDRCYSQHLLAVDMAWQLLLEEERRANPKTDPDYQMFLACSQRHGRPASAQGSLTDILADLSDSGIDPLANCIQQTDTSG